MTLSKISHFEQKFEWRYAFKRVIMHSRKDASDVSNVRASEKKERNVSTWCLKKDPTQKNPYDVILSFTRNVYRLSDHAPYAKHTVQ